MGEKIIMENRKLIAEALLEIAQRGHTDFIENAAIDKEIKEAAKRIGIELPSPDLMVMKTVYAEIDKVNLNGVILPRKAVEKGLKTLIGKQCNWEHDGAGFVCGYTIDAKINDDKIETINVIFKSLFPEQAEELKEKVKSGEAAVSFEIWNIDPESKKSVVKETAEGYKELSPIIFHGTGVLLVHSPACPKAKVFKLVAKNLTDEAKEFVNNVFSDNLVYASLAIENNEKEDNKVELLKLFENVKEETDITMEMALAFYYASEEEQKTLTEDAAKWTRKFINSLPDSAFAVIEPAYPEKTEDKNARHLPHHNGEGDLGGEKSNKNLDLLHYKNALARCNQINPVSDSISAEDLRAKASAHLERHKDALEKAEEKIEDKLPEETKTEVIAEETKIEASETQPTEKVEEKKEEATVAETKSEETKVEETKKEETPVEEPKVEAEVKSDETPKEESEAKVEEPKAEEKAEEKKEESTEAKTEETETEVKKEEAQPLEQIEPKVIVKVTHVYSEISIDTYVDGTPSGTSQLKGYNKKITEYKDGTKDEVEEEVEIVKKYDFAEAEAKNKEIADLKTVNEELDKEIKKLQKELDEKNQEIANLTIKEVKKEEKELTVGSVEAGAESEVATRAKKINEIIANKRK